MTFKNFLDNIVKESGANKLYSLPEPQIVNTVREIIKKYSLGTHQLTVLQLDDIAKKVIDGLYDGVSTQELDELASETAATLTTKHPDFATLAARIAVSNLHKTTSKSFSSTMKRLYTYVNPKTGENASLLSKEVYGVINKNAALLDSSIIYDRDFSYDYFGFKTLEKSYLLRLDGKVVERPQHMLMRVAIGIHMDDMDSVLETYNLLSEKWFTHATPTLFNAGTPKPQLSDPKSEYSFQGAQAQGSQ